MLIYDHKMENSQMMFQISKYYVENLSTCYQMKRTNTKSIYTVRQLLFDILNWIKKYTCISDFQKFCKS